MRGFLTLIILIGLAVAGWTNRDRLGELWSQAGDTAGETIANLSSGNLLRPGATPHPAREAQVQAKVLYPGLALPNSPMNQKFVALYKEAQTSDPTFLSNPDWPLQLADRAIVALGGAPMPRSKAMAAAPSAPTAAGARPQKVNQSVIIYTTSSCPYCVRAKRYLAQKGVSYREVNVETSLAGKEAYRKLGANGVPIIMVGDTKVDGFDEKALDRLLL